jgi:putative endonuclease
MAKHNELGHWGEQIAAQYLESKAYKILLRNYRVGRLELDLVIQKEPSEIVVVEVKTRSTELWQDPLAAVDQRKQKHLLSAGNHLLHFLGATDTAIRFDLISVVGTPQEYKISHIKDAFYPF